MDNRWNLFSYSFLCHCPVWLDQYGNRSSWHFKIPSLPADGIFLPCGFSARFIWSGSQHFFGAYAGAWPVFSPRDSLARKHKSAHENSQMRSSPAHQATSARVRVLTSRLSRLCQSEKGLKSSLSGTRGKDRVHSQQLLIHWPHRTTSKWVLFTQQSASESEQIIESNRLPVLILTKTHGTVEK